MMLPPRSYAHTSNPRRNSKDLSEKDVNRRNSRSDPYNAPRRPSQPLIAPHGEPRTNPTTPTTPVRIPSHRNQRPQPMPVQQSPMNNSLQVPVYDQMRHHGSVRDLLSATSIPVRKKPKGRLVQRLPDCDHVADFSRLLSEDLRSKSEGQLSASFGNSHFEGLFGNIDELMEGQMFVGSDGLDATVLTPRSVSSESMLSLASPDDFHEVGSSPLFGRKSPSDRRLRQLASSEDCGSDHPLVSPVEDVVGDVGSLSEPTIATLRSRRRPIPPKPTTGTLKSTLSASLRALKSAAASVSHMATTTPTIQPDDFFAFQPNLTDDKRPPPSSEPPSPALRRYLNPLPHNMPAGSPVQLHFWHEERPTQQSPLASDSPSIKVKNKRKKKNATDPATLPRVVPLQSCIPPAVRTAHASSPPIWLTPDGQPSNKHTAHMQNITVFLDPGTPRPREPRENRDFLRVLVAEMNMRRAGKLQSVEDGGGRAVLWLPPVKEDGTKAKKEGRERWTCVGVEDEV